MSIVSLMAKIKHNPREKRRLFQTRKKAKFTKTVLEGVTCGDE